MATYSKHKILSLFTGAIAIAGMCIIIYFMCWAIKTEGGFFNLPFIGKFCVCIFFLTFAFVMSIVMGPNGRIEVDDDKIIFTNFIFSAIRKTIRFNELDYYIIVPERGRYGEIFDTVWLIRNGYIKKRFSNANIANLEELADAIGSHLPYCGKIEMSSIQVIKCMFGWSKVDIKE